MSLLVGKRLTGRCCCHHQSEHLGLIYLFSSRGTKRTDSLSPEEPLSVAFATLKNDPESCDRMTPLRVFRSPRGTQATNVQSKIIQMGKNQLFL